MSEKGIEEIFGFVSERNASQDGVLPLNTFNEVLKTFVEAKAACTSNEKFVATLFASLPESEKTLSTKTGSRYNVTCSLDLSLHCLSLSSVTIILPHDLYISF